jgi:hypothetical protein
MVVPVVVVRVSDCTAIVDENQQIPKKKIVIEPFQRLYNVYLMGGCVYVSQFKHTGYCSSSSSYCVA